MGGSGSTVEDACEAYKAAASQLGRAWREQKWRAWLNDPMKEHCCSMEFGYSGMPGGSEVQKRAERLQQPFELRSMRDLEGRRFYDRFVAPWLLKAWEAVLETASEAEAFALREQLGSERTLSGT
eukprot:5358905-Pleurochrysis_carterae.AAC.1